MAISSPGLSGWTLIGLALLRLSMAPTLADDTHATVVASLKTNLVGKGTFDNKPISDVKPASACITTIKTSDGTDADIDWSKQDNPTARSDGAQQVVDLMTPPDIPHVLGIGDGATAQRVKMSVTVLYLDCVRRH